MKLTENFSLEELIRTGHNTTNVPDIKQKEALKLLAEKVLQPAREMLGRPITVTSGFRSVTTNRLVGGLRHHSTSKVRLLTYSVTITRSSLI